MKVINYLLLTLFFPLVGLSQELIIYTFIPASPINYDTPKTAFSSRLRNTVSFRHPIRSHPVGHLVIELRKDTLYEVSGYSANEMFKVYKAYLMNGIGLGVLFMPVPARIESIAHDAPQLVHRRKSGRMSYLRFKVSDEAFDRMWAYLQTYRQQLHSDYLILPSDPQKDSTAYCSSFAMSFLDVAQIGTHFKQNWLPDSVWQTTFKVPEYLIGQPFNTNKVGLLKLLFRGGRWATTSTPYREINLQNPYLLHEWIQLNWRFYQKQLSPVAKSEKQGRAKGLFFDYSTH